ncbi:MAG: hypothetical protein WCP21_01615 [Armatimonadota bacterium]
MITQSLAGPEAERVYHRRKTLDRATAQIDLDGVRDLALKPEGGGEKTSAFVDWLNLETRDAVDAW